MKRLLFLRHGEADHPAPAAWSDDSRRPLTADGVHRMAMEARGMKALGLSISAIVTSPYVRARQTADQVAREYRLIDRITEAELLEPGGSYRDMARSLKGIDGDFVMIVGHAPDLGLWLGEIVGAGEVPLGKGWLAVVKLREDLREGTGRLWGLFPADVLVAAGRASERT